MQLHLSTFDILGLGFNVQLTLEFDQSIVVLVSKFLEEIVHMGLIGRIGSSISSYQCGTLIKSQRCNNTISVDEVL